MITIRQISQSLELLKPLSATAPKLAAAVADPETSIDKIATIIQYDQALTLDILKYANSAQSASARTIATVKEAVIRLGGTRVLERVIGAQVKSDMSSALPLYGYAEKDLWRHSVAAAVAAEQLCAFVKSTHAGMSFTAALLHDIGKLILGRTAPKEDSEQIALLVFGESPAFTCEQAEKKVLGFSHADIGAEIAAAWQLPPLIVEAIRNHHRLTVATATPAEQEVSDMVKAANIVARCIGEGIGIEGMSLSVDTELGQRLHLSHEQFEAICAQSAGRLNAVLDMFT
jgi:putative nucleotidyltransferase with HDIG domain